MKKIITILVIGMIILSLSACGADKKNASLTLKEGVLTVAISPDFAPMEFVDTSKTGQDQYVGFDVTLAKFIAEELGLKLEIKPMGFDPCQAAVQSKTVDMSISGYSWTETRAENYNLSDYYYAGDNETEQIIIVLKEDAGKWTTAADYSGKTIACQIASLQYDMCTQQLPADCEIKVFADIGIAVESLRNDMVDGVAVANGNGEAIIANNDSIALSGFEFEVSEEAQNNVCMLHKDNDALLEKVNEALAKAYAAGYYAQWYEEAKALAGIETAEEVTLE